MFWGKRKDSDSEIKEKTLRELKSAFPSIRRPNNDDTVYELLFEVNSQYNTLRMFFAPDFPASRPVLQVVGAMSQHTWLDQYKRVIGCDKLTQWTKTSSMVDIVSDTLGALQYQVSPPTTGAGAGGGYVMVNNNPNNFGKQNQNQSGAYYNHPHIAPGSQSQPPPAGMAQIYQQQLSGQNTQNSHFQPNVHHATQLNTQPAPGYPYNSQNQSQQGNPYDIAYQNSNTNPNSNNTALYHRSNPASRNGSMTIPTAGMTGSHSDEHLDDFPTTTPTLVRTKSAHRKVPVPDIPDSFPELENMTEMQLEKLVNDEVARAAHIKTMHMVVSMEEIRDDLKLSNLNDAKSIVEQKSEISKLHEEVGTLKTSLTEAVKNYRIKAKEISEKYTVTKEDVLKKEDMRRTNLDNDSEELAEMFSAGKKNLTDFIAEYMSKRIAYHEINAKIIAAEKS